MTTLYVATPGGHLAELSNLADRIPPDGAEVWVSSDNVQSRSVLAGREVQFVHAVAARSVLGVLRCLPTAHRLWRGRRLDRAISNGSGMALGFLPYLAARGVECHYIECAARVTGPSLTGKIMRWMPGVRVHTQYRSWAGRVWSYAGSQFDGYEAGPPDRRTGDTVRVVVTVGASTFPFRRMIENLVPLLTSDGELHRATGLPVEVLWQTGATEVDDLPIEATPMLPITDLTAAMSTADIVVSHAGIGSALAAAECGRCAVMVARAERYGEASDDHQSELESDLNGRGLALQRDADTLTIDDLLTSWGATVRRCSDASDFRLHVR